MQIAIMIAAAAVVLGYGYVCSYARLTRQRTAVTQSRHQLNAELNRRHDLLAELAGTVRPPTPREPAVSTGAVALTTAARTVPDLQVRGLQEQLRETEERIASGTRFYNGNVQMLNRRVRSLPSSLVARLHCVRPEELIEIGDGDLGGEGLGGGG
jgi:hypothetical protein